MATYSWSVPTGNIITGNTYIKDTDNKIQDTMDDLADFVNSSGAYTGQGLLFDYVNKASNQTITGVKTFSNGLIGNVNGNITGNITGNVTGNVTGNSDTSSKLKTARIISVSGDIIGSITFDGSSNVNMSVEVANDSHTHDTRYYTETEVDILLSNSLSPLVGMVIATARTSAPSGFLECNGALISRVTYSNLFNAIGVTYGVGDGSTTFQLPDLRGEFIRGWDNGRGIDIGRVLGSYQADAYLNHSHTGSTNSSGAHTHTVTKTDAGVGATIGIPPSGSATGATSTSSAGAHTHTVTVDSSTTGSTETRPRNIAMMYCIKY